MAEGNGLGLEFRINDAGSLAAFAALNRRWIEQYHEMEDSDLRMVADPALYTRGGGRVITAHLDGRVAGAVALKPHGDGEDMRWELTKMAVDPAFHGRGVGAALLEEAHRVAREVIGAGELFLLSNTVLEAAQRLYRRHGWEVNHRGPHPVYARANIGMRKVL